MIEVKNLTKSFNQKDGTSFHAVENLSFTANDGEIVCLLGVNGAGKTTTMRILSTVFKPTSGTATINNYDILTEPQKVRENLGFLSGDTGLYNRLTSREFITYFGRLYGLSDAIINERINNMSVLLDMQDFIDKKIDFFSSGMKQKASIVRSIIHDPPVMIFDEPTSGLDILTARNIVSFIRECKNGGKCVLFSTHIMREAERIADRIVMIHKGKLIAEGKLEELRDDTSQVDLDDIFVTYVNRQSIDSEVQSHEF
jgi:sodium transport system ATP-binding protein